MNRDLVAALLSTVDNSPPWELCRQLLAAYDQAVGERDTWRAQVQTHAESEQRIQIALSAADEDSARLAAHIVAHPVGPYRDVLALHDRRVGS